MKKQHDKRRRTKKWAPRKKIPTPRVNYPKNDSDRAVRFAKKFGRDLRYVPAWKTWLVWDGVRWVRDEDGAVFRKGQEMHRLLLEEAVKIEDDDHRKKAVATAIRAGDESKINDD